MEIWVRFFNEKEKKKEKENDPPAEGASTDSINRPAHSSPLLLLCSRMITRVEVRDDQDFV